MNEKTEVLFDIGDEKLMTIGAVVDRLKGEFPDISVSKLRYLEEQGLVTPRRTKGGYRLFSRDDYQRLIRVLALQRDEYLPLKVIRKEIERTPPASPGRRAAACARPTSCPTRPARKSSPPKSSSRSPRPTPACSPSSRSSSSSRAARSAACAATPSSRPAWWRPPRASHAAGLRPKNLRAMKSAVDREGGLIEQVILPALRSHRAEQRQEALDALEELAQAMSQLQQLLLTRYIRRLTV